MKIKERAGDFMLVYEDGGVRFVGPAERLLKRAAKGPTTGLVNGRLVMVEIEEDDVVFTFAGKTSVLDRREIRGVGGVG